MVTVLMLLACGYVQHVEDTLSGQNGVLALITVSRAELVVAVVLVFLCLILSLVFIGVGAVALSRDRNRHVTVHLFLWGSIGVLIWTVVILVNLKQVFEFLSLFSQFSG